MIKFIKQKNKACLQCLKHSFCRRGFTLVETLVAISIFTMSILAVMVILGSSISHLTYAKRKLTATFLAQEGIEYVRNLRDTYVLYPETDEDGWDSFTNELLLNCGGKGCYFNVADLTPLLYGSPDQPITDVGLTSCNNSPCPYLNYHSNSGVYDYDSSGVSSGIRRVILVNNNGVVLTNTDEVMVTSTVYWTQGSGNYEVSLTENLFNWTK